MDENSVVEVGVQIEEVGTLICVVLFIYNPEDFAEVQLKDDEMVEKYGLTCWPYSYGRVGVVDRLTNTFQSLRNAQIEKNLMSQFVLYRMTSAISASWRFVTTLSISTYLLSIHAFMRHHYKGNSGPNVLAIMITHKYYKIQLNKLCMCTHNKPCSSL